MSHEQSGGIAPPRTRGVLLLNLGSPSGCDPRSVRRYLAEFLADPEVIKLPRGMRWFGKPLARMIARSRAKQSAHAYASVWTDDGSPLLVISDAQGRALAHVLGRAFDVRVAMRYGHPSIDDVVASFVEDDIHDVTAVPMYPQFAGATTGTALAALYRAFERHARDTELVVRNAWYDDAGYIQAQVAVLNEAIAKHGLTPDNTTLVFSAHSLPVAYIKAGDPYQKHIVETVHLVSKALGWPEERITLAYQSKLGPVEWLAPQTAEVIESLAKNGTPNVFVCPISFTADCLESLEELDIRGRDVVEAHGSNFHLCPALNDHPAFIEALAGIVRRGTRPIALESKCSDDAPAQLDADWMSRLVVTGLSREPGALDALRDAGVHITNHVDDATFAASKRTHQEVRGLCSALGERGVEQSVVVSTCARVEAYSLAPAARETEQRRTITRLQSTLLTDVHDASHPQVHVGHEAYRHAVLTAAGLLSSLPGDNDVRLQLCSAARTAEDVAHGATAIGMVMTRATEAAQALSEATTWRDFRVGFADVALDGISRSASVDWTQMRSVVVLGGSTTARSTIHTLRRRHGVRPSQLTGIYRTRSRGKQLKALRQALRGATPLRVDRYDDARVLDALAHADVIVFAHDAREPIWSAEQAMTRSAQTKVIIDFNSFPSTRGFEDDESTALWRLCDIEAVVRDYAASLAGCERFRVAVREALAWLEEHIGATREGRSMDARPRNDRVTCTRSGCGCKRAFVPEVRTRVETVS